MSKAETKFAIIGIGNCGNQVAYLAEKKYGTLFESIYINTSSSDLSQIQPSNENLVFKIGDEDEVEGSGKNRSKMKEYLRSDIKNILEDENLQNAIVSKKYVFVIASVAGGTGSGAGPVLFSLIEQQYPEVHFILVSVLPYLESSLMEHGNSKEFLEELYNKLDSPTYMIYDNETVYDQPATVSLTTVNNEIVEDLRVLTGVDNLSTPYESIDPADMESILTTPGRVIVVRLKKNLTEKAMEDTAIDDMIIRAIKRSCHAETDRNKRCLKWGIITHFTEEVNKLYRPAMPKLADFLGNPKERFNHNAINTTGHDDQNFLYLIASGLSPINDRTKKIDDRILQLLSNEDEDKKDEFISNTNGVSYNVMEERKKQDRKANQKATLKISETFDKFM